MNFDGSADRFGHRAHGAGQLAEASVAIARLSYLVYERPMIRVVRRFFSIRPRAERHDESIGDGVTVEAPPVSVSLNSGS